MSAHKSTVTWLHALGTREPLRRRGCSRHAFSKSGSSSTNQYTHSVWAEQAISTGLRSITMSLASGSNSWMFPIALREYIYCGDASPTARCSGPAPPKSLRYSRSEATRFMRPGMSSAKNLGSFTAGMKIFG